MSFKLFVMLLLEFMDQINACAHGTGYKNTTDSGSSTINSALTNVQKIIIGCVIGGTALLCVIGYIIYWYCANRHGTQIYKLASREPQEYTETNETRND
eukprot:188819_1